MPPRVRSCGYLLAVSQTPAGWYPDPTAPPATPPYLRYWDGQAWTEHAAAPPTHTQGYAAGPTTPDGVPLAGWWWRVLAYIIDSVIIAVPAMLVIVPDLKKLFDTIREEIDAGASNAVIDQKVNDLTHAMTVHQLPVIILSLVYFAGMLRWKGGTLGHLAVGLRVRLRDTPGRLPWAAIVLRVALFNGLGVIPSVLTVVGLDVLASGLSVPIGLFVLLNVLWATWDRNKQALHDKVARTNVVKVR